MVKVQRIKRKDGFRYFIYLPTEYVEGQGIIKGEDLELTTHPFEFRIVVTK